MQPPRPVPCFVSRLVDRLVQLVGGQHVGVPARIDARSGGIALAKCRAVALRGLLCLRRSLTVGMRISMGARSNSSERNGVSQAIATAPATCRTAETIHHVVLRLVFD